MLFSSENTYLCKKSDVIRTAIAKAIEKNGISKRRCALDCKVDYSNFCQFLLGKRTMPLMDIEKVMHYLKLEIKPKKDAKL